eukprot:m.243770 g.243770  ORF g.243770 m.243770 type:complete len:73 (-) comp15837_c0_seq17:1572-1790(-)
MYPDPESPQPLHVASGMPHQAFHSCLSNQPGNQNSNWGNFSDIPNNMTFEEPMQPDTAARLRRGWVLLPNSP